MNSESSRVHIDRVAGSLTGLLVGDALGVPYEFHASEVLPPADEIDFQPPDAFRRSHCSVPPGTWSDDGAQALVLLESLLAKGELDLKHFANGLQRWMTHGFCAVDGHVFDVGIQTGRALRRLGAGVEPRYAGPNGERDNGNGSLMRVLPLALWHRGTDQELAALSSEQSLPTHGHSRARIACALYSLWVRCVLSDKPRHWDEAVTRLKNVAAALEFEEEDVECVLDWTNASRVHGTGYVVDSLWSARAAVLETSSFEACVRRAVSFGNDTDTTAAIAGGVAGAMYGLAGIPERWRSGLRGNEILAPLLKALQEHLEPPHPKETVTKTSQSHPLQIANLQLDHGRIGVTFCPGKKQRAALSGTWERDLATDLGVIRDWGARDVVSLIETHEMVQLGVEGLSAQTCAHGMRWHHLPIPDQQTPDSSFEILWAEVLPVLLATLKGGGGVVVHCKGGLGRAGTVGARLLLAGNPQLTPEEAIAKVREVRPGAIENRAQELHVRQARNRDLCLVAGV